MKYYIGRDIMRGVLEGGRILNFCSVPFLGRKERLHFVFVMRLSCVICIMMIQKGGKGERTRHTFRRGLVF